MRYAISEESVLTAKKNARGLAVAAITVTTASGKVFNGDETSQDRMARAVLALNTGESVLWVLADNIPTMVTREEIQEALRLSGIAQSAIWAEPYL